MILLKRITETSSATYGALVDSDTGLPLCVTVERPWKNNEEDVSCIPQGTYHCKRIVSPKHGEVFEVTGVPKRTHIQIHVANYAHELKGCIAPGLQFMEMDNKFGVSSSRVALKKFHEHMEGQEWFVLRVINCF